jgi:hypothetical protein
METRERLAALARVESATPPVISVYLDTRWGDEHQRERVRVFLKEGLARARNGRSPAPATEDLAWIEEQGEALVAQARFASAGGVALFACGPAGVRDVLPARMPFEPAFAVAPRPVLTPLAAAVEHAPPSLVAFVDGETARLLPFDLRGADGEVTLEHEVPGRHARGAWAQLAQSRYQRHVEAHREQHFEAVADALDAATLERAIERLVLAGEPRAVSRLQAHLPARLAVLVAGTVPGSRHEPAAALRARAAELLEARERERTAAAVDAALAEAAKGGRAVFGAGDVIGAVRRGAVQRLYLLRGFEAEACACVTCQALHADPTPACRTCGAATRPTSLREALVAGVLVARGTVEIVEAHAALATAGGVAARLRFPL